MDPKSIGKTQVITLKKSNWVWDKNSDFLIPISVHRPLICENVNFVRSNNLSLKIKSLHN